MKNKHIDTNLTVLTDAEITQVYAGNFDDAGATGSVNYTNLEVTITSFIDDRGGSPVKPKLPIEL